MSTILKIEKTELGSHEYQTANATLVPPNGWCLVPDSMMPLNNFPYGEIETTIVNDIQILTSWSPIPIPVPPVPPEPTPAELRRNAYETEKIVEYPAGTLMTVDEANQLYLDYLAEGDASTYEALQVLIVAAKQEIRARYPD